MINFFGYKNIKQNILYYILILIFLCLAYNVISFTEYTSATYVQRDGWRFIDIYLIPYYSGEFTFKTLFLDPIHSQPIVAFLQIFNAEFFSLNMLYESYVGVFFILLTTILIIKKTNDSLSGLSSLCKFFLLSVILLILLSVGSIEKLTWSLVTLGYIPLYFLILSILFFEKAIKNDNEIKYKIWFFVLIVISYFIQKDTAILISASIIITLFILYLFNFRKYTFFIFSLIISFIFVSVFMSYLDAPTLPSTGVNKFHSILLIFKNPKIFLDSVSVAFLSPIVSFEFIVDNKILTSEQYVLFSYVPFILSMVILFYFIKNKVYIKTTIVPLVLLIFALLFMLAIIIFRYPPIDHNSVYLVSSLRYITIYEVMIVSVIWMFGLLYVSLETDRIKKIIKYFCLLIVTILVILNIYNTFMAWKKGYYINLSNKNVIQNLIEYEPNKIYPPYVVTKGKIKEKHIDFLKENNLNVYKK